VSNIETKVVVITGASSGIGEATARLQRSAKPAASLMLARWT
jgi:NADP-dependent 3-hydroxy acid dehydrogenase YdfG